MKIKTILKEEATKWEKERDYGAGTTFFTSVNTDTEWQIFSPYPIKDSELGEKEIEREMKKGNKFFVQWNPTDGSGAQIKHKYFKDKASANKFVEQLKKKLK